MFTWVTQHFLNPAFFWPGLALVSVPIIIHLINRLHYRKVRFAAMEFLLASEQKNRRRILLEQLLLLLLRILMVLLLTALIARLVLSASQLSLFQGAKSHHLVLLDDSGSMRDRVGDTAAFDEARTVIRKLVAEGANRPGTQKFTLLLGSRPDQTLAGLSERDINDELVDEVSTRLEDLNCTHQAIDMGAALEAARSRLVDDATDLKHLHVISDFRRPDWFDNKAVAGVLRELDEESIAVNLVRSVGESHENLALVDLTGDVEVAAAGVPVSFTVKVANYGTRQAEGVRISLAVDGRNVPRNLVFETIDAGRQEARDFEIVFETAGPHHVQALLESDSLEQDNVRHLAVNVPNDNPVLIIDGTPGSDQGQYVADALAADQSITGYSPTGAGLDYLRQYPLDGFHLIYLINVAELPADAVAALEKYVEQGGGLAWFLGDAVRPAFYNDKLYQEGAGLFPAPLESSVSRLDRDPSRTAGADIEVTDHPLFRILGGEENPFLDLVFVNDYFPLDSDWIFETLPESTDVAAIAELRNGAPLILEHEFGDGRIVTCLTSAGPLPGRDGLPWNNWANGPAAPSYAVFQLDLAKHIARRDRTLPRKTVGEPITETFSRVLFLDQVEFVNPNNQVTEVRAAAVDPEETEGGATDEEVRPLSATFRETDDPGVYAVRTTTQNREQQERLIAYNVPTSESELAVVTDEQIRAEAGDSQNLTIQQAGVFDWIRSDSPGEDVRWLLLLLLVVVGVCEQAMAYRLSYHPR